MRNYPYEIPILLASLLLFSTTNIKAETNLDGVRNLVMQSVKESEKGVIMVVSERGQAAANAAYLLSDQLEHNPGYKPLLMVPMESQLRASLKELALNKDALPAVIFFNKSGKEVARVVDAIPSSQRPKIENVSAEILKAPKLEATTYVKG